ncbi:uncharacterized protein LOC125840801 [Solanum verrucosum]|uniref:uncharacterized protein LOC125840801 n=1 Tax=Solanum verrucosum TaxID=315347 RepID=UPI0020D03B6F|nr:uncharacterized protein LOC125840801 [Solanum verrucosum]
MTIVLRYVDRRGSVMERFLGIVHIRDTTALSLKNGIIGLLAKHSLSQSYVDNVIMEQFLEDVMKSRRRIAEYTILHHYQVEVFYKIIDWQRQELNNRFDKVTTDLLLGIACLNPDDSFSNLDMEKILRLVELYPDDFDKYSIVDLRFQLENDIVDVRDHDKRFFGLKGLSNLSKILVETKKHKTYHLVFRLVKFDLLLPMATATVERVFLAMKLIKTDLRNQMDDELLSGCLTSTINSSGSNTTREPDPRIVATKREPGPRVAVIKPCDFAPMTIALKMMNFVNMQYVSF